MSTPVIVGRINSEGDPRLPEVEGWSVPQVPHEYAKRPEKGPSSVFEFLGKVFQETGDCTSQKLLEYQIRLQERKKVTFMRNVYKVQ